MTTTTNTAAALTAHASRIHNADAASSLPQSIEGLNFSTEPPFTAAAPRRGAPESDEYLRPL